LFWKHSSFWVLARIVLQSMVLVVVIQARLLTRSNSSNSNLMERVVEAAAVPLNILGEAEPSANQGRLLAALLAILQRRIRLRMMTFHSEEFNLSR